MLTEENNALLKHLDNLKVFALKINYYKYFIRNIRMAMIN